MQRPVLKQLFEGSKSIPVARAIDNAKSGPGTIVFEDNVTVIGNGTQFTKSFHVGDTLNIPAGKDLPKIEDQLIEQIVSDTKLILKKPGIQLEDQYK